ncbi:MAG: hypothetical protein JST81_01175 [Bacteroidetes bacterium]|nr:hypothetical protein [Bacteroidota bacterium]
MINLSGSFFKKFLLFSFLAASVIIAQAQRPEHKSREYRQQGNGNNRRPNQSTRPQFDPNRRHDGYERGTRPPRTMPTVNAPANRGASANRFPHVNRDFREHRIRIAPRPDYLYVNHAYRRTYYRAPVYSAHNPCWRYTYLPARRTVISSFPFSFVTINFGGFGYRYYNGTFYQPFNNSFIVVAPPIGLPVTVLPFGYSRIFVNSSPYYYYNGTYYNDYNDGYQVVAPPVGALVESIPQGYETITIDGETYYKVDGVQYKPEVQDNGEIWYRVLKVN